VTRRLTRRFAAELSVDYALGEWSLTNESRSALEAARASFMTAFNGLFTAPPIASRTVNATATLSDRRGRQVVTTGALLVNVTTWSDRMSPYLAIGAAAISQLDTLPRALLEGTYQFVLSVPGFAGPAPTLNQVDSLAVRSSVDDRLAWVFGGGLKYTLSNRWAVRLDVRDSVRRNSVSTFIDAAPATTSPTTFGVLFFLSTLGNPPVVFSGNSTFSASTLSGSLKDFRTFRGTGLNQQIGVTAGVCWRF
jgi:hypothetical protein